MTGLVAHHLHKSFGSIQAVRDIGFSVPIGQTLALLGPNGAGKTTTLRLVTGYLQADQGSIAIMGHDLQSSRLEAQRHVGYVPEGVPLYNELTAIDYLKFMADLRGLQGSNRSTSLDRVIQAAGLANVLKQKIDHLSKGFKRRVGLAQALLHDPSVLILDEPTDGLDPNQKYEMRQWLKSVAKQKAVIISTHILEEVEAMCNRVMVIDRGVIVADTTPQEFNKGGMEQNFRRLTARQA
ncbi:MAG: ABC transporter ATP-binding protein [Alphaproteobacteria bacterium]|nr:MAG: ABC transporter ATP-binding protein [Alphaproteobacteria bacterium]